MSSRRPSHQTSTFLNSAQSEDDDMELAIKLSLQESQQLFDEKTTDDEVSLIAHIPAARKNSSQSSKRLPNNPNQATNKPPNAKQDIPKKSTNTSSTLPSKASITPSRPHKQRKGSTPTSTVIDSHSSVAPFERMHTSTTTETSQTKGEIRGKSIDTTTSVTTSRQRFRLKSNNRTTEVTEEVSIRQERQHPGSVNPPPPFPTSNGASTNLDRAMMRDHLHRGSSLPRSLATSIHQQTQEQMMEMAIANSLAHNDRHSASPPAERAYWERDRASSIHEMNSQNVTNSTGELPEYFEDDEMLARALHESLNGH